MLRVTWRVRWFVGLSLALAALGPGCRESKSPTVPSAPAKVTLSPAALSFDALGDTARVQAEVRDQYGKVLTAQPVWRSLAPGIASVSAEGLVQSAGEGSTSIIAAAGAAADTVAVVVHQVPRQLSLSVAADTLLVGDTLALTATVTDRLGRPLEAPVLQWSAADAQVADVTATGRVSARSAGHTVVTVTCGTLTASVEIVVHDGRLVVSPAADTINALGDTLALRAVLDDAGHERDCPSLHWSSSDSAVARVTAAGAVISRAVGQVQVTATCGGLTASASILVRQVLATLRLTAPASGLLEGDTLTVAAVGADSNGFAMPVAAEDWTSSAPAVATVAEGKVTGVRFGGARISAQAGDALGELQLYVVAPLGHVAATNHRTCALDGGGNALCWGWVIRPAGTISDQRSTPVLFQGGFTYRSIASGMDFFCGLASDGVTRCWGDNTEGALGNGTTEPQGVPTPPAGGPLHQVVGGFFHACGLDGDGRAYCSGYNGYGQFGDGSTTGSLVPVPVSGGHRFRTLVTGGNFVCGIATDGLTYCWGYAGDGQTGRGTGTERQLLPQQVEGGLRFAQIAAGAGHACGVTDSHELYCWGNWYLDSGQDPTPLGVPTRRPGAYIAVSAGSASQHTCAWTLDMTLHCWGANEQGQLGLGRTSSQFDEGDVIGGRIFVSLGVGDYHTCGITPAHEAYCWGEGTDGRLGDGQLTTTWGPDRPVAGGPVF